MQPLTVGRILALLPKDRGLALAKGLGLTSTTLTEAVAEAQRRKIEPRRVLSVLTDEELRAQCTQQGIVPSPKCTHDELIGLALGETVGCESVRMPWWNDPRHA
jgi:hypothetical protein